MARKAKKLYQKPIIKEAKLIPEEALLAQCKVTKGGEGPGSICSNVVGSCERQGASS